MPQLKKSSARVRFQNTPAQILHFPIVLQAEPEGGFTVTVPSLPGCITWGKNLHQAQKMAREAIELYLEDMRAEGEMLPARHTALLGEIEITLPARSRSLSSYA